jgi:hypothetical protein
VRVQAPASARIKSAYDCGFMIGLLLDECIARATPNGPAAR